MTDLIIENIPARTLIKDEIQNTKDNAITEGKRIRIMIDNDEVKGFTIPQGKICFGRIIADLVLE